MHPSMSKDSEYYTYDDLKPQLLSAHVNTCLSSHYLDVKACKSFQIL
jgi:hypothetical protein